MSNYTVHTEEYKGFTIKIEQDDYHENPRTEWDNLGRMLCVHRRYNLGDDHRLTQEKLWQELAEVGGLTKDAGEYEYEEILAAAERNAIILPLFLYDHSGITMSTSPFSCQWDSGQVGFIYVTREKVRQEYHRERVSPQLAEKVRRVLRAEVEVYDHVLRGNVYGYIVEDADGEEIESCWGFIGDYDEKYGCLQQARETADYALRKTAPLFALAGIEDQVISRKAEA